MCEGSSERERESKREPVTGLACVRVCVHVCVCVFVNKNIFNVFSVFAGTDTGVNVCLMMAVVKFSASIQY